MTKLLWSVCIKRTLEHKHPCNYVVFIEYQYQKVIDLCGNFTIYTHTHGRWQKTYTE